MMKTIWTLLHPPIHWTYHRPRTPGGNFSEITAAEPYVNSTLNTSSVPERTSFVSIRSDTIISEAMKASARIAIEEGLQQQIVERLNPNVPPDSSINDSDPSYSPPPDIIPPAATVVGVPLR